MVELVERLRLLEQDHEPDGWPAVRMRDITALLDALEAAREDAERLAEALRSFADDARNAFYATGCASCDGLASRLANSAAALRDHDQEVGNG